MSGIVASSGLMDASEAKRMLSRLAHRGSDGAQGKAISTTWIGSRWTNNELTPIQPITSDDGQLHMVADGEIYNYRELLGLTDETAANPGIEAVLPLYQQHGIDAFRLIDGPFSLVIVKDDGHMTVARDPLGIRPLYWYRDDERVVFASELGAFDEALIGDVRSFPPGHVWTPEAGLRRFVEPMSPNCEEQQSPDRAALLAEIRNELVSGVESQLMGDTDVGAFLSGGLDSSLITAIAQNWMRAHGKTLKTFAVGLEGSPDIVAAREVAAFLDTDHHEETYSAADALAVVPEVVRTLEHFDPSLVRSSVANYILGRFVSKHVDVVLTGEGSDEIFAGYSYLCDYDDPAKLHAELVNLFQGMHCSGLQRVDRTSTIHGLMVRLPFLSAGMIELGMSIPPELKRIDNGEVEKRLLREAFEGWLPHHLLWRKKAQFGDGSGAVDALQLAISEGISEKEFERERHAVDPPLRSREELAYYRMYAEHFGTKRTEEAAGRFATV